MLLRKAIALQAVVCRALDTYVCRGRGLVRLQIDILRWRGSWRIEAGSSSVRVIASPYHGRAVPANLKLCFSPYWMGGYSVPGRTSVHPVHLAAGSVLCTWLWCPAGKCRLFVVAGVAQRGQKPK